MAKISSTTNLDKFQQDFNKIGGKSHARLVTKNGQEFLIKGSGKGKMGRWWFGVKFKQGAGARRQLRNKNVVDGLRKAADRSFGALGPKLVNQFLRSKGLADDSTLSTQNVKDAVKYVKTNINQARKQEETNLRLERMKPQVGKIVDDALKKRIPQQKLEALLSTPTGRMAYEAYIQKTSFQEDSFYMMEEAQNLLDKFPKGGPKFREAAKAYIKLFVGNLNDPVFANVPGELQKELKDEVAKNPMNEAKVRELLDEFFENGIRMISDPHSFPKRKDDIDKLKTAFMKGDPGIRRDEIGLTAFRKKIDKLSKDNEAPVKELVGNLKKNLTGTPGLKRHFDKLTYNELVKLNKINNPLQQRNAAVKILNKKDDVNI